VANGPFAVAPSKNDRRHAMLFQTLAQMVCIIALIGNQSFHASRGGQRLIGGADVADIAGRQPDDGGTA
jgi:hypothetical protein